MPAILDDPSAGTIHRVSGAEPFPDPAHPSFPDTIVPRHVTLRDRTTVATVVPFASRHQVPDSLLHYLHDQFNNEIEGGDTYPMIDPMEFDKFADYWFQNFAGIMLLGEIKRPEDIVDNQNWPTDCLGTFYIKPNYPGRSSHICNAGFIVTDTSRNRGVGRLMGETYLDWAPKLGYTYSVFNLVYETNVASVKIWDGLGFKRIGRVKGAGNLKSYPDQLVDAVIFGRDLGDADGNEELVSEERFDKIKYYLQHARYPPGADRAEKSRLRSAATHYRLLEGGVLMLKDREVIADPRRQYKIATEVHNQSHAGINRTTATITERYHWSRIKDVVSDVIRNCSECKELGKSSLPSASQARQQQEQQEQQEQQHLLQPQLPNIISPPLSNVVTPTSCGIKRPNPSPPVNPSNSKRPTPTRSPGYVMAGDTVTIGDQPRSHPIPGLPPEPPSHIDLYTASSHQYNQSHSQFTDASGHQISILTSPSPGPPMQVTPDTTTNLATVQHNPFTRHTQAHESPMLPHHPSPPPPHHHHQYLSPYPPHTHHERQHHSEPAPSHYHQSHHPHVSLPPLINPQVIRQPGPASARRATAHHHTLSNHGQVHNEQDYTEHHQPQIHQSLHHRHPLHPPPQHMQTPTLYSSYGEQIHPGYPQTRHHPRPDPSHGADAQHYPQEAMRNVPMEAPSHIMLQHDPHHLQYPSYQYPQSQQQHPQQLYQHHPHQQPQQQQAQQHQSPGQLHQHQQQHHTGGASSTSEPDNDSDTFQALLTVTGTEAVGIRMGRSDHNERSHPDGRVGYYDPVQELGSGRPDVGREDDRGDQRAGSSGGGQVGGYGSLTSARSGSGMERGDGEGERNFGQDGRHGTGPESLSGGDHQMDEDGMAVAAADDEAIDQDLDMLIETSSGDEGDKGQNEYQNAAAVRSRRYTPIMEGVREQQPIPSTSANGDVEMATDNALGSRFTSINNNDGNGHGQQGSETTGAARATSISSTSTWNAINDNRRRSSSPRSDAAEEPERDDNDIEMALNGDLDEYDEDNNRDQDRDQDDLGLPGDNMDMAEAEEDTLEHEHHDGQALDRDQDQDQDWQERVNNHTDTGAYGDTDHNVDPHAEDADPIAMDTTGTEEAETNTPGTIPGIGTGTGTGTGIGTGTPASPAAGAATTNPESGPVSPGPRRDFSRSNERDTVVDSGGGRSTSRDGDGSGGGHVDKEEKKSNGTVGGSSGATANGGGGGGSGSVNGSGSGNGKMDVSHLLSGDDDADGNE